MEKEEKRIKDRCIICGHSTGFYKDEDINKRKYYIKGTGQLCKSCYSALHKENSPQK